jgi:hypothetical protein
MQNKPSMVSWKLADVEVRLDPKVKSSPERGEQPKRYPTTIVLRKADDADAVYQFQAESASSLASWASALL